MELGIIGIILAFETPRLKLVSWFSRLRGSQTIIQIFKVHTVFHAHNNGKPLSSTAAENTTDKKYLLIWEIQNKTGSVLQLEESIIMRRRNSNSVMSLTVPGFSAAPNLFPNHKLQLLSLELTPEEVDHYRHWIKECDAFGLKDSSGCVYWIDDMQFKEFQNCLQSIAKEYGLTESVPEGKKVFLRVNSELRPQRLILYNKTKEFLHYCSTYETMQHANMVNGTRDLIAKLDSYKKAVDELGPLSMPDVENKIGEIIKNVWRLQRVLDRLPGPNPLPIQSEYDTAEENLDGLIDWFASSEKSLKGLFEPFLKLA